VLHVIRLPYLTSPLSPTDIATASGPRRNLRHTCHYVSPQTKKRYTDATFRQSMGYGGAVAEGPCEHNVNDDAEITDTGPGNHYDFRGPRG